MKIAERRRGPASMKRFYDWFYLFYGLIEKTLEPRMDAVLGRLFENPGTLSDSTAIEYACGSGSLARRLSGIFGSVEGRDTSPRMLMRARRLALAKGHHIRFEDGNVLEIHESERSYDFVFVSFALHLFSKEDILAILSKLLLVAREEVVIIDHPLKWAASTAFVEWIEGSYYDRFIELDFEALAREAGAGSFSLEEIAECSVMRMSRLSQVDRVRP
jgi:ubiquinone/menaquinone biosynthesis C-methylase UbiE